MEFTPTVFWSLLKNLQDTHTWNFLTFSYFWLRIPIWTFVTKTHRTFGSPSTKLILISFTLSKKYFWIFFFFRFLGSPGTPWDPDEIIFHILSVGLQNRVKRVCWIHFWILLLKIRVLKERKIMTKFPFLFLQLTRKSNTYIHGHTVYVFWNTHKP